MKYSILILLLLNGLMYPIISFAETNILDDGDNLYVYTNGAVQAVAYSMDKLDKITFGQNAISISTKSGQTDYAYESIDLMTFRNGIKPITGFNYPTVSCSHVKWMYDRTLQTLRVMSGLGLSNVTVFDAQGRVVINEHISAKEYQLSLEEVHSGVYVVKVSESKGSGTTIKIIK